MIAEDEGQAPEQPNRREGMADIARRCVKAFETHITFATSTDPSGQSVKAPGRDNMLKHVWDLQESSTFCLVPG